jgi:predicted RNase H-like HicB family nuclease
MRYVALIDGKKGAYGVVVPDLPGCTSQGRTIDAAYRNAIEAVRLWVEDALEDGEKIPEPRSMAEIVADPELRREHAGAALVLVPLVRNVGRPKKANVSLDAGTLDAIDAEARAHGLTRSAFIASAAIEKIRRGT